MVNSIKGEIIKAAWNYFELNNNKNIAYETLYSAAKSVLRGSLIPSNAYIRKKNF